MNYNQNPFQLDVCDVPALPAELAKVFPDHDARATALTKTDQESKMRNSDVKDDVRFMKFIFWGVIFLFITQLSFQLIAFFSQAEFKGGLINARMLLWDGLQTWPVQLALIRYCIVYFLLLSVLSVISILATKLMVGRLGMRESEPKLMVFNLMLLYGSLMVINGYHYPNSWARIALVSDWQSRDIQAPIFFAGLVFVLFLVAASVELSMRAMVRWRNNPSSITKTAAVISLIFFLSLALLQWNSGVGFRQSSSAKMNGNRPGIILIGLDSVRLDVIEDEDLRSKFLPNLDRFLTQNNTAWFPNSYTPIARTFAAWYALLSGKQPKETGVRYNLQQLSQAQKRNTIVPSLKKNGYYAIYGSDEKRFSVIDESFGFDETLGPPPGAAEWLLSFLEDTPIHNILRDTRLGRYLFPHTYGNRASFTTHKPEHFVELVRHRLETWDHARPLFLSIHLCLSHWPYTWSASGNNGKQSSIQDYFDSLQPLDSQFGEIINALRRASLLENSVVVVFTDHGEGLVSEVMNKNDFSWNDFRAHLPRASDFIMGHGTDLLTLAQNQILVSIQDNTDRESPLSGKKRRVTSLLDITPTIARFAQVPEFDTDGIDLANETVEKGEKRVIFLETGFDPGTLQQAELDIAELVRQGASAYEITPKGLLQIKNEYHDQIISNKQVGVTDGRFILSGDLKKIRENNAQPNLAAVKITVPNELVSVADLETNTELSYLRERLVHFYADEFSKH
ncbi:sulfatase-like hydrolase/transferase [Pseudomonadota bacterium]